MLHVITGPPAAGKTTFARENAADGDIIIDLDHLANALAGKPMDNHEHTGDVLAVAKAVRQTAIDTALTREVTVWLIHTNPSDKQRAEYKRQGAEFHTIDPGKQTVMARCKQERPHGSAIAAAKWYDERKAKPTITIESFGFANGRPNGGLILDARDLPNPHDIPALRVPNGQSERVRNWLHQQTEVRDFIQASISRIDAAKPARVFIGCNSGKHRAVYIADELAEHYGITAAHRDLGQKPKKNFRQRGYSHHTHDLPRKRLLMALKDGSPCWWCGLPMHKDKQRNWDGWALAADHSNAHGAKNGEQPDRLLHGRCNSQRQDGRYDARRPALTGKHPSEPLAPQADVQVPPRDRQSDTTTAFIWK